MQRINRRGRVTETCRSPSRGQKRSEHLPDELLTSLQPESYRQTMPLCACIATQPLDLVREDGSSDVALCEVQDRSGGLYSLRSALIGTAWYRIAPCFRARSPASSPEPQYRGVVPRTTCHDRSPSCTTSAKRPLHRRVACVAQTKLASTPILTRLGMVTRGVKGLSMTMAVR